MACNTQINMFMYVYIREEKCKWVFIFAFLKCSCVLKYSLHAEVPRYTFLYWKITKAFQKLWHDSSTCINYPASSLVYLRIINGLIGNKVVVSVVFRWVAILCESCSGWVETLIYTSLLFIFCNVNKYKLFVLVYLINK